MSRVGGMLHTIARVPAYAAAVGKGMLASLQRGRVLVLTYHRVCAEPDALMLDEPTRAAFDGEMRALAQHFNVVPLAEVPEILASGAGPTRAIAITFDDGYRNNFEEAMPILQKYGLPATFFVATGFLEDGCMWNDRIIEALRRSRVGQLDLEEADLGRVLLNGADTRRGIIDRVLSRLKHLPLAERDEAVARIVKKCGVDYPRDLMMTREQVAGLHQNGFSVGAHTVNHPILTRVSDAEAEREITEGKRALEDIIDAEVDLFAYPNGRLEVDYAERHVALVRAANFRLAVSTNYGPAQRSSSLFELPRVGVQRRNPLRFRLDLMEAYAGG